MTTKEYKHGQFEPGIVNAIFIMNLCNMYYLCEELYTKYRTIEL